MSPTLFTNASASAKSAKRFVHCRPLPSSDSVQPGTWGSRRSTSSGGKVGVPGRHSMQRWDVRGAESLGVVIVIILQVSADREAVSVEVFDHAVEGAVFTGR